MLHRVQPLDWHTTPSAARPASPAPWKRYLGEECPHGRQVVLVDGTHVRNHHDSDFSQGGNGYRYRFVPRGEIWIDEQISPDEWPFIAFHECEEAELMRGGLSYERAHDRAKKIEDYARRLARRLAP